MQVIFFPRTVLSRLHTNDCCFSWRSEGLPHQVWRQWLVTSPAHSAHAQHSPTSSQADTTSSQAENYSQIQTARSATSLSLSSHGHRPIIRLIFIGVEIIFIFFLFLNLTVILNLKKLSFDSFLKFANKLQQQPLRLQPPLLQAKVSFLIWQQLLGIFNFRFVWSTRITLTPLGIRDI